MDLKESISEVKELFNSPKKVVITTHRLPDGDAMGSSLGLYNMLIQFGHDVQVITPNHYPAFLHWMPGDETVIEYETSPAAAKEKIAEAEIIFSLDYNNLNRLQELGPVIETSSATKILIDHHLFPDSFPDYSLSDTTSCSTAQLVYDFFVMMGWEEKVNKPIAECLYTGIMTDTLSFKIATTTAHTHEIAGKLIAVGVKGHEIQERVFDNNSESRLRLIGHGLLNKLKVFKKYNAAYISFSVNELKQYNYKTGDTEGLVNMALSIEGVKFATLLTEREDEVRLSMRSSGDFSVNELAKKHFEGGGHKNAAGGRSDLSLADTEEKLIQLMEQYEDELTR